MVNCISEVIAMKLGRLKKLNQNNCKYYLLNDYPISKDIEKIKKINDTYSYYMIFDEVFTLINDFIFEYVLYSFGGNKKFKKNIDNINIKDVLADFSNLENDLVSKIHDHIQQIYTILYYFYKDKKSINKKLGNEYGNIKSIDLGGGDIHEGKTVSIIHCDFGNIIFKPQRYNQYLILEKIVNILKKYIDFKYIIPKSIIFKDHSWVEYIEETKIRNNEINEMFYILGIYEGIFYVLGSTDMHYENCIISRGNPIFIDLETLCGNNSKKSVLYSEIIPHNYSKSFKCYTSIIFNPHLSFKIINKPTLESTSKNNLVIKNKVELKKSKSKKFAKLYGNDINLEFFINGFIDSYNVFLNHKEEIKKEIETIVSEEKIFFRVVVRNTSLYYIFLENIRSIDSRMNDYREKILSIFKEKSKKIDENIISNEIACLKKGYIPSYYCNFIDRSLYTIDGKKIVKNYFSKTLYERINENIDSACDNDLYNQIRIVRLSYLKTHLNNKTCCVDIRNVIDKIKEVYYAFFNNKNRQITCLNVNDNELEIGCLKYDLFNSIGLVICLSFYAHKLCDHSLDEIIVGIIDDILHKDKLISQHEENIFSIYVAYMYIQNKEVNVRKIDFSDFININNFYIKDFNDANIVNYILKKQKNTNILFDLNLEGAYSFSPVLSGLMNQFIKDVKNDKRKV